MSDQDVIKKLTAVPEHMVEQVEQADWLALRARAAAQAGNHELAEKLRDELEAIYDRLEASLEPVVEQG